MSEDMKTKILGCVSDCVMDLLEDQDDDEYLPNGSIEQAIKDGVITIDEMVDRFRAELIENRG